jgi:hypothetical protein
MPEGTLTLFQTYLYAVANKETSVNKVRAKVSPARIVKRA